MENLNSSFLFPLKIFFRYIDSKLNFSYHNKIITKKLKYITTSRYILFVTYEVLKKNYFATLDLINWGSTNLEKVNKLYFIKNWAIITNWQWSHIAFRSLLLENKILWRFYIVEVRQFT